MNFTDIFVRRPVLATVVSLIILILGLRSLAELPVREFPRTEKGIVTVTTTYYGADPDLVAGFITTPLENAIAQANGIDYLSSTSQAGVSTITATLRLNYDTDKALTEVSAKVNSVLNQLPQGTQQPVIGVQAADTNYAMYLGFYSGVMTLDQMTDYLIRVVQPKMQSVVGVQTAAVLGARNLAMRAWLDPQKLAAYGLTASDVNLALAQNDYISGIGNTKGRMVQVNLVAKTNLRTVEEFRNLALKQSGGAIVRLKDVAEVALGAEDYESQTADDGRVGLFIGIQTAPSANLVQSLRGIRDLMPGIVAQLPEGMTGEIGFDSTVFVESSIHEVERTLVEAVLIVTVVVFVFLGSLRSVLIPTVAIPLSLVGTFTMMAIFGFSTNLLTLLALVLAIGLVVDDAIIVVENVSRHIDAGMKPMAAAVQGARELGGPIIAMTAVLVAVYVPIGFQSGLTGALFTEFAFTLVGTVTISAIVALTLSPMMCSRFLVPHTQDRRGWQERLAEFIDRRFAELRGLYRRQLHNSLDFVPVTVVFAAIVLSSIYFLYGSAKSELAPQEDQGFLPSITTTPPNATLEQKLIYQRQIYGAFSQLPETLHTFAVAAPNIMFSGVVFKPWDQRSRTTFELHPIIQQLLNQIAGSRTVVFQPPSLPGSFGFPVQFVVTTTDPFDRLNEIMTQMLLQANKSGMFLFTDTDLKLDEPQSTLVIDRDEVAQLGLKMSDIGSALGSMLGGGYVNYFSFDGRSYKVIPQVQQRYRLNTDQLLDYYISTPDHAPFSLATVAHIENETVPESLNHFQQLNAAILSAVPAPGVSLGDALAYLKGLAGRTLPQGYGIDYGGASRQYVQESSGAVALFGFALILIFLVLAALFESFRDPLVILLSVPMSIAGALVFISLGVGGATINIYTEVGLVTLMGLISKHGILLVEFANELQLQGKSKREAIEEAAAIRLRPILMTTAAMVLGVIPLIVGSGAGAQSRYAMGLVIASGLSIGTFFTLFIVPAAYLLVAADRSRLSAAHDQGIVEAQADA